MFFTTFEFGLYSLRRSRRITIYLVYRGGLSERAGRFRTTVTLPSCISELGMANIDFAVRLLGQQARRIRLIATADSGILPKTSFCRAIDHAKIAETLQSSLGFSRLSAAGDSKISHNMRRQRRLSIIGLGGSPVVCSDCSHAIRGHSLRKYFDMLVKPARQPLLRRTGTFGLRIRKTARLGKRLESFCSCISTTRRY